MNTILLILLVVAGVALLIAELFLLPGFGLAGITGFVCLVGAVVYAFLCMSPTVGYATLVAVLLLSATAIYAFLKGKTLDKMALETDITAKVDLTSELNINVGDKGLCVSRLAPMGKVRINGQEVEGKSQGSFIEAGTEIEVLAIDGNKVIVK